MPILAALLISWAIVSPLAAQAVDEAAPSSNPIAVVATAGQDEDPAAATAPDTQPISEELEKAQELREKAEQTRGWVTYVALFAILIITGFGLPLPEEIPLLLAGYLARHGAADLWGLIPVGVAGAVLADMVLFLITKRWRSHIFRFRWVRATLRPRHVVWVRKQFHNHGLKIVVVARWLPAMRTAICITAGLTGVRFLRFLLVDLVAASITVPTSLLIGYFAARHIDRLVAGVMQAENFVVAAVVGTTLAAVLVRIFWWHRIAGKRPEPSPRKVEDTPPPRRLAGKPDRAVRQEEAI